MKGLVYILHFEPAYKHAGHYVGWTGKPFPERVVDHVEGRGSPLVAAAVAAGCRILLGAVFEGTRDDERRIKVQSRTHRYCRCCSLPHYSPHSVTTGARLRERYRHEQARNYTGRTPEVTP